MQKVEEETFQQLSAAVSRTNASPDRSDEVDDALKPGDEDEDEMVEAEEGLLSGKCSSIGGEMIVSSSPKTV